MASKFDRVIFPVMPKFKEEKLNLYLIDMRKSLDVLLTVLKQSHDDYLRKVFFKTIGLADDATWERAASGIYVIVESTGDTYAIASCFMNDAVTILHEKTGGDWDTADTDGKYCLMDQTTYIQLKNRKGSGKKFAVMVVDL